MKQIIIAENSRMLGAELADRLNHDGYQARVFANGADSIAYLRENKSDLLITDLFMPVMDGIDLIHKVRNTISENMPILAMAYTDRDDFKQQVIQLGASDYVAKSIGYIELSIRIKLLIGK